MKLSLNIAGKLRMSLAAVAVGLGLIAFAYWRVSAGISTSDQRIARFQQASTRVDGLVQALAEARRLEAEYALSFTASTGERFRKALADLAKSTDKVQPAPAAGSKAKPPVMRAAVDGYLQEAKSLDERVAELGHDADSGLQGELRDAVHGVESVLAGYHVPELQVAMLTMRRNEKDFMLRHDQKYADQLSEQALPFELLLQKARIPEAKRNQIRELMQHYQDHFTGYAAARFGVDSEVQALDDAASKVELALTALRNQQQRALEQGREQQARERARMNVVFWVTLLVVAVGIIALLTMLLRAIVRPLDRAVAFARDIANDRLDGTLAIGDGQDEIALLSRTLLQMQASLRNRIEAERATARENQQVRQALDAALAAIMVVDAEGRVVYANAALSQTLERAGVSGHQLVGTDAAALGEPLKDVLALANSQGEPVQGELALGDTRFELNVSPVTEDLRVIGFAVEWQDRRLELVIEHEVAALVGRAAAGHLDERIGVDGKQGFLRLLVEDINNLLDSVQRYLDATDAAMARFAEGDLSVVPGPVYQGVFARLQHNMEAAMRQVGSIVIDLQHSATGLRSAADEMVVGTDDLSRRTERQADDLQQATALMADVSDAVVANAERAQATAKSVEQTQQAAREGRDEARAAIEGMEHIRSASHRVVEIVATVNGIAFQTNLLALNAAVEAARAGEHGRGFAVVASEVRSLAQRSSQAAEQIRALIDSSLERVEQGARRVDSTGAAMARILDQVGHVNELMDQVRVASEQQGEAVTGIDALLHSLGDTTAQNAALAEETSAAAGQVLEQAARMAESASAFKTQHADAREAEYEDVGDVAEPADEEPLLV